MEQYYINVQVRPMEMNSQHSQKNKNLYEKIVKAYWTIEKVEKNRKFLINNIHAEKHLLINCK